jgi:hypothetical protein
MRYSGLIGESSDMHKSRPIEGKKLVAQTEKSIRDAIIDFMEISPASGGAFLINSRFFPCVAIKGNLLSEAEALAVSVSSCIDLRMTSGLRLFGSVGKRFQDESQELSNSEQHRNKPVPLCKALLRVLESEI